MRQGSSNSASFTASRLIRHARLTLLLSCDPQARTTARAARIFWLFAVIWSDRMSLLRLLPSWGETDSQRAEFYRQIDHVIRQGSLDNSPPA